MICIARPGEDEVDQIAREWRLFGLLEVRNQPEASWWDLEGSPQNEELRKRKAVYQKWVADHLEKMKAK